MVENGAAAWMPEYSVYQVHPQRQLVYKGQRVEDYIHLCYLVQKTSNDFHYCNGSDGGVHRRSGIALPGHVPSGIQGNCKL